jgi:hypothetical protein
MMILPIHLRSDGNDPAGNSIVLLPAKIVQKRVGRALLSAAFDVDFELEIKTKVKTGGQECPPHTTHAA